jgi:two-component system cell cycle response regulator DivK
VGDELILIIEDNALNLKLVRDVLDDAGYRTLAAVTAEDGLALAAAELPDLILMDVQLPAMDGVSALGELRAQERTAAIPVLVLTAFAMESDRERFLSAGFDGYLEKPIDVRELRTRVRGLLHPRPEASRNGR